MITKLYTKFKYKLFPELVTIDLNLKELLWAEKFKMTVQNKPWLHSISLSPNGMAVNFSFLYILTRILDTYKPQNILEFGLGESSKYINCYLENTLNDTFHDIIENDGSWINDFLFTRNHRSNIFKKDITLKDCENVGKIQCFDNLNEGLRDQYDLYIIDGPRGIPHYSRYDICLLAQKFCQYDNFIILFDDSDRPGEKETLASLFMIMDQIKIKYYVLNYTGSKTQTLIYTEKYNLCYTF